MRFPPLARRTTPSIAFLLIPTSLLLAACLGHNGGTEAGADTGKTSHSTAASPPSAAPGTFGTVSPPPTSEPTTQAAPTTSTTTSPPNGNTPILASVSPDSALPGQTVTLSGSGFFSADGAITVRFGGTVASVSCQSRTACHATVPAQPTPGPTTAAVTITTDTGTSQAVAFTYG